MPSVGTQSGESRVTSAQASTYALIVIIRRRAEDVETERENASAWTKRDLRRPSLGRTVLRSRRLRASVTSAPYREARDLATPF